MKKILVAALLSSAFAAPAFAADTSKLSVGAGYGFDNGGVLSIHGDYNISDMFNNKPVKARFGIDHYALDTGTQYTWSYNVFYAGAYYDFTQEMKLNDRKIHPFAGLGLGIGSVSCSSSGNWCNGLGSPSVGGLYYILGVQYDIAPKMTAEANFNGWGGLSLGVNYKL